MQRIIDYLLDQATLHGEAHYYLAPDEVLSLAITDDRKWVFNGEPITEDQAYELVGDRA